MWSVIVIVMPCLHM
uniref:Uncharacterized protein n=1 Tax=Steinernema glaseri TaxID=37863 RepID=A0A1I8AH22_9BILA